MSDCDVLVVDDQAGVRYLLYEVFREIGYKVSVASSGQEALDRFKELRPRVVLLDVKMPGMGGLEVLDLLRKMSGEVRAVIMTAYGEMDMVQKAKEKGIEYFIVKPFDIEDVRSIVCRLVEGAKVECEE